jgi:hypothetical protein
MIYPSDPSDPAASGAQRFQGSSVRAVLADIRETLGRDALILSERRDGDRIEMLAAIDSDASAPAELGPEPEGCRAAAPSGFAFHVLESEGSAIAARDADASRPQAPEAPASTLYRQRLLRLGFADHLLDSLPEPREGWPTLIRALAAKVRCAGPLPTAGIVRFAGPRGAGVTTALLRYACHLIGNGADPRRMTLMHCGDRGLGRDAALQSAGALLGVQTGHGSAATIAGAMAHAHPETLVLLDESSDGSTPLAGALSDDPLTPEQLVYVLPAHWRCVAVERWLASAVQTPNLPSRQCAIATHTDQSDGSGYWFSLLHDACLSLACWQESADPSAAMAWADAAGIEHRLRMEIDRYRAATTFKSGEPAVEH